MLRPKKKRRLLKIRNVLKSIFRLEKTSFFDKFARPGSISGFWFQTYMRQQMTNVHNQNQPFFSMLCRDTHVNVRSVVRIDASRHMLAVPNDPRIPAVERLHPMAPEGAAPKTSVASRIRRIFRKLKSLISFIKRI